MKEVLLDFNELVPDLESVPDNNTQWAPSSHFGWLSRIFSPAKPRYSSIQETTNSCGDGMFYEGRFSDDLEFHDRAIELSPNNATYHNNRAAALSRLGRTEEAVNQWEEAIKLDPNYTQARHDLALFLLSLGHLDDARKLVKESSHVSYMKMANQVEKHLNKCINARRRGEWNNVLNEARAAMLSGASKSTELAMCIVEALVKLNWLDTAQTELAAVPEVEPLPASFSQSQIRVSDMISKAYSFFVKSQIYFALERYKDAAEAAAKALEIDPHNIETKIFKKNVELVQSTLSYSKLEKWAEAVRNYQILHEALPYDKVIATSLSQAQVALKQSRREVTVNMESGDDVKEISSLEELKAALARHGIQVTFVHQANTSDSSSE